MLVVVGMYEVVAYPHGQKSYLSEYLNCERRRWTGSWQGSDDSDRKGSHARREIRKRYPTKPRAKSNFAELTTIHASLFYSLRVLQYDSDHKSKHWIPAIE